MTKFFRFPHTPHLAWLGRGKPRGDKVLSEQEARAFLAQGTVVEEKVDGANVGMSVDDGGEVRLQNRGQYISRDNAHPQFRSLFQWVQGRKSALESVLTPSVLLFGEWCYAVHSVRYQSLPDWYLLFDVYDRHARRFWSVVRRDELARRLDLSVVPLLGAGRYSLPSLKGMLQQSKFAEGPAEGLYVRQEAGDWLVRRAKLVNPAFAAGISEHWTRRPIEHNQLATQTARR